MPSFLLTYYILWFLPCLAMRRNRFTLAESMKHIAGESHGESKASHVILGWVCDMSGVISDFKNHTIFKGANVLVIDDFVSELEVFGSGHGGIMLWFLIVLVCPEGFDIPLFPHDLAIFILIRSYV